MTNDNTFNQLVNPPHPVFNYSTRFEKKVEKNCKYLPTKHVLIFKIWLNAVSNFSYIASFQTGATTGSPNSVEELDSKLRLCNSISLFGLQLATACVEVLESDSDGLCCQ